MNTHFYTLHTETYEYITMKRKNWFKTGKCFFSKLYKKKKKNHFYTESDINFRENFGYHLPRYRNINSKPYKYINEYKGIITKTFFF